MSECQMCGTEKVALIPDLSSRRKVRNSTARHIGFRVSMVCDNCGKVAAEATFGKDQWVPLMIALSREDLIPDEWVKNYATSGKIGGEHPPGC